MRTLPGLRRVAVAVLTAVLVTGCAADRRSTATPEPSPSVSTLSPLPLPPPPDLSGTLGAEVRQASRDVALDRFQVWVRNGTGRPLRPDEVGYADPRFATTLSGGRLREVPSGRERGFTFAQPARPRCEGPEGTGGPESTAGTRGSGRLTVRAGKRSWTTPVSDEADVIARYVEERCLELAVARIADLSFLDRVPAVGEEEGPGRLLLRIEPTGRAGRLVVEEVTGTPVLTPAAGPGWRLDRTVGARAETVPLPVRPARCDGHAFAESAGATTFRVAVRVAGERGTLLLPMSPRGAAAAIGYAKRACGLP